MKTAEEVLKALLKEGKISKEDVTELEVDEDARTLTLLVHAIFCKGNHDTDECMFPKEGEKEDEWELPFHLLWRDKANALMNYLDIGCEKDLTSFISAAIDINRESNSTALMIAWMIEDEKAFSLAISSGKFLLGGGSGGGTSDS